MTKTINDFLSPDDLMLAGPAENAPSDYWSKPAIEGDGNQKQGLTWDVVRATKEELKNTTKKKKETLVDPMTAAQRSAVDEITAPVKVNYGRYAGRRAVPAGILGSGIAYGTYENE